MNKIEEVDKYIQEAPKDQTETLDKLRDLILKTVPHAKERFKWSQPVYTTEKDFVYLKSTKSHVNLGFFNFDKVTDTNNILEGKGKRMRHIKIKTIDDFDIQTLKAMIKQSSKFD